MADICTNAECFVYLGIAAPTSEQTALMTMLRKSVESSVRRFCRWNITEAEFTSFLPAFDHATGSTVRTANYYHQVRYCGGRDRLQLPQMLVKSIDSIYEDFGALAGQGTGDFAAATELTEGIDFFLEKDHPSGSSFSGAVLRVNRAWSSTAGTIKATFTAGFDEDDLDGDFYDLKFEIIREAATRYSTQGSLSEDNALGQIKSEKLGDWGVSYGDGGDNTSGQTGLSERLKMFLNDNGYVMMNVGV